MSRVLDTRYWLLDTGYSMLDTRCSILDAGCYSRSMEHSVMGAKSDISDNSNALPYAPCSLLDVFCFLHRKRHVEQSGGFIKSQHDVHILNGLTGGSLYQVVNG